MEKKKFNGKEYFAYRKYISGIDKNPKQKAKKLKNQLKKKGYRVRIVKGSVKGKDGKRRTYYDVYTRYVAPRAKKTQNK